MVNLKINTKDGKTIEIVGFYRPPMRRAIKALLNNKELTINMDLSEQEVKNICTTAGLTLTYINIEPIDTK